jgi:signal transduction histidine kinase
VTNACKYRSPARPLVIQISGEAVDHEIVLAVGDNGVGMTPDDAAHAFEPLFRARSTAQVPGTGLGLAIVKRTVEAIGGGCQLESVRDVGTRVELHLPAA